MKNLEISNSVGPDQAMSDLIGPGGEIGTRLNSLSSDHFRLLAENIPTMCWMANSKGDIFWYNKQWHDYCGTTANNKNGWGWQSVHHPDALPGVLELWVASIEKGAAFELTFLLRGSDDVFRQFLTRIHPARDDAGKISWWFGVSTEITAQVEAERRLEAAHQELHQTAAIREAMLAQLSEGIIITNTEGKITFVNDMAVKLHGVARLDVGPENYVDAYSLLTPDGDPHPTETLPLVRAIKNLETVIDAHWRIQRSDGTEVLVIGNAQPFFSEDGRLLGAVLIIRDDTERHNATVALADALQTKEILLHEVNHRVKNSLQLVTSLLMLQANQANSPELKKSLIEARARISVVASVHKRLYTTAEHHQVDLVVYLKDLAKETIAALNHGKQINFRFASLSRITVTLDRAIPTALLLNELLTNALKYAFIDAESGNITLEIHQVDDEIHIILKDTGCGLPAGFDPADGTGLGMQIVTALVQQINGSLEILENDDGTGFHIRMPVSDQ